MKKALLFINLALLSATAYATKLTGIIDKDSTLTKANSPYIIDANFLVHKNAKLTIEPGVEIKVSKGVLFYIDGAVDAAGTDTDPIRITRNYTGTDYWWGIMGRDSNANATISFNHCIIEGSQYAVKIFNHPTNITNCTFQGNYQPVWLVRCNFSVSNNMFKDYVHGMNAEWSKGTVANNKFSSTLSGYSFTADNNVGRMMISGNSFNQCAGRGIKVYSVGNPDSLLINDNVLSFVTNDAISIYTAGTATIVKNNLINYCNKGLLFTDCKGRIYSNTIKHVKTAVTSGYCPTYPLFESNCIDSVSDYYVMNTAKENIVMPPNYWGTTDTTAMLSKTFDYYDNFTSGKVYYGNFMLNTDVSCKNAVDTSTTDIPDVPHETAVLVSPNPFSSAFTIEVKNNKVKVSGIEVYNMVGKRVAATTTNNNKTTITLESCPAGVYLYKVLLSDGTAATGRLVKQ